MSASRSTAYVVDDDESIRSLWQWLMGSNGIAVQTFATATAFIDDLSPRRRRLPGARRAAARHERPGAAGLPAARGASRFPIVFVSAHGDVPTAVNAIKGGAVDFIQKPFDYREALAIVRRRAGARRAGAASGAPGESSSPAAGRAHRARARGAAARDRGQGEQGHRRRARDQREDRRSPSGEGDGEDGGGLGGASWCSAS